MQVKKVGVHPGRDMSFEPGETSGAIDAHVKSAGHRAGYRWAASLDGGKT